MCVINDTINVCNKNLQLTFLASEKMGQKADTKKKLYTLQLT